MAVVLVPEYLAVIILVGGFRGWLFPLDAAGSGLPSCSSPPLPAPRWSSRPPERSRSAQGLALAGLSLGAVGALLITLPDFSLPGAVMVGRAFSRRATVVTAAVVVLGGLADAALLQALPS